MRVLLIVLLTAAATSSAWIWATGLYLLPGLGCSIPKGLVDPGGMTGGANPSCWEFWFNRYQTLAAAGVALLIAFVTLRPALRQLAEVRLQSKIMARNVLVERLAETEKRAAKVESLVSGLVNECLGTLYPHDPEEPPRPVHPEWAFNQQAEADRISETLRGFVSRKVDPSHVDRDRAELIADLDLLARCFDAIHSPYSRELSDPDYNLSPEQIGAIHKEAEAAEPELTDRVAAVNRSGRKLRQAYLREISRLQAAIREVDDFVSA